MKRLRIVLIGLCVVVAVVAVWYISGYVKLQALLLSEEADYLSPSGLPDFVQEEIRQNRAGYFTRPSEQAVVAWGKQVTAVILDPAEDARLAEEALQSWQIEKESPECLSMNEIGEELDFLFRYLKYSFALYSYRGGDEAFVPLFAEIRNEVEALCESGQTHIATELYMNVLRRKLLPAVGDMHAYIGSQNFSDVFPEKQYTSYTFDGISFTSRSDGTFAVNGDERVELVSVDGEDPAQLLRPGILKSGEIAYVLWLYTDESAATIACELLLAGEGGDQVKRVVELNPVEKWDSPEDAAYHVAENDGYFYLRNSTLMSVPQNKPELARMVREASGLKGSKPVVLDLRRHGGGNDYYALFWILRYLGLPRLQAVHVPIPVISYDMNSRTVNSLEQQKLAGVVKTPGLANRHENGGVPLHIANETPLFVIVDRGCGSSGEWFAAYLSRLDQVVVVGEHTRGMLVGGNQCTAMLPVSRCKVTFSTAVNMDIDFCDKEGIGLAPDLYVPPSEAVERVAAMLEYYGI